MRIVLFTPTLQLHGELNLHCLLKLYSYPENCTDNCRYTPTVKLPGELYCSCQLNLKNCATLVYSNCTITCRIVLTLSTQTAQLPKSCTPLVYSNCKVTWRIEPPWSTPTPPRTEDSQGVWNIERATGCSLNFVFSFVKLSELSQI